MQTQRRRHDDSGRQAADRLRVILAFPGLGPAVKLAYVALWLDIAGQQVGTYTVRAAEWAALVDRDRRGAGQWLTSLAACGAVKVADRRSGRWSVHVADPVTAARGVRLRLADPQREFAFAGDEQGDVGQADDDVNDVIAFGRDQHNQRGRFGSTTEPATPVAFGCDRQTDGDRFGSIAAAADFGSRRPDGSAMGGNGAKTAHDLGGNCAETAQWAETAQKPPVSREEFGEFGSVDLEIGAQSSETQGAGQGLNPERNSLSSLGGNGAKTAHGEISATETAHLAAVVQRRRRQREAAEGSVQPQRSIAEGVSQLAESLADGRYEQQCAQRRERWIAKILDTVNSLPSQRGSGQLKVEPARKVAVALVEGRLPAVELERIFAYLKQKKPAVPWQMFVRCCQTRFEELHIKWEKPK